MEAHTCKIPTFDISPHPSPCCKPVHSSSKRSHAPGQPMTSPTDYSRPCSFELCTVWLLLLWVQQVEAQGGRVLLTPQPLSRLEDLLHPGHQATWTPAPSGGWLGHSWCILPSIAKLIGRPLTKSSSNTTNGAQAPRQTGVPTNDHASHVEHL